METLSLKDWEVREKLCPALRDNFWVCYEFGLHFCACGKRHYSGSTGTLTALHRSAPGSISSDLYPKQSFAPGCTRVLHPPHAVIDLQRAKSSREMGGEGA